MFCKKCGAELNNGIAFCPKCGTKAGLSELNKPKGIIPSVVGIVLIIISFALPEHFSNDGYNRHIAYLTVPKFILLGIGIIFFIGGVINFLKNKRN